MVVGVLLALAVVVAMVMAAVWLVRTKALLGRKSSGGVAFENPSYLREVNMDHIQVGLPQCPYKLAVRNLQAFIVCSNCNVIRF